MPSRRARAPETQFHRRLIALVLLILVGTPAGIYVYHHRAADAAVEEAIAEVERLDPGWRLEEIEAKRAAVPDEQNSALVVRPVEKVLPPSLGRGDDFTRLFEATQPQHRLSPEQLRLLRRELAMAAPALAEARKLEAMEWGRFPIRYAADGISTVVESQPARAVASLLAMESQLLAEDGQADEALARVRGILNAGRAVGDEPTLISMMIRAAARSMAASAAERVLAQGEPSEAALAALQRLLEKEAAEPLLPGAMRGERAWVDRFMAALQRGEVELEKLRGGEEVLQIVPVPERWLLRSAFGLKYQRAAMLRFMTDLVETTKRPRAERDRRLNEIDADVRMMKAQPRPAKGQPWMAMFLHPPMGKAVEYEEGSQARLRCTVVAVAAERYRLRNGCWPEALAHLVAAGLLKDIPDDPYDGKPLRWVRRPGGAIVYSIGEDGADNLGHLDREFGQVNPGSDLGFQLWDVASRRQPPLPPRPEPPREGGAP